MCCRSCEVWNRKRFTTRGNPVSVRLGHVGRTHFIVGRALGTINCLNADR